MRKSREIDLHPEQDYWAARARSATLERREERRRLQWAALGTLLLHGALLMLRLPEGGPSLPPEPERVVFAVRNHVLRPEPEPEPVPEVRPERPDPPTPTVIVPGPPEIDPEPVETAPEPIPLDLPVVAMDPIPVPADPPPSIEAGPVRWDGSLTKPQQEYAPLPHYTDMARRARRQGKVIVEAVIEADGRVTDVRVLRGLGFGLDESAVATVSTWRFRPAMRGGRPVAVIYTLVINFRLQ